MIGILPESVRMDGTDCEVKRATVGKISTATDTTIIAAVAGKKLRLVAIYLHAQAAISFQFKNGVGGAVTGALYDITAVTVVGPFAHVRPFLSSGWVTATVSFAIVLTTSAVSGGTLAGDLLYIECP